MINSLIAATISQHGLDKDSPMEARRKAIKLFSRMLFNARQRSLWLALRGRQNRLQDLNAIAKIAERKATLHSGIVTVPLNKIVGSEGRSNDFDSTFAPLAAHDRDRWAGIAVARKLGVPLPPVELIQVADEYFVRDGHHRISVANAVGQVEIEAQILYTLEPTPMQ